MKAKSNDKLIPWQSVIEAVETMDKKNIIKYVVAFTYGDGCLLKHGKYSRFEANNIVDNRDYSEWRASILGNLTKVNLKDIEVNRGNRKDITNTTTMTHPMYDKVRCRMYLNKTKVIDKHYLTLFDWETLAILFMDDGSNVCSTQMLTYKHKYGPTKGWKPVVTLATCNFSYGDNWLLKKAMRNNLGIEFNINKHSKSKDGEQRYILVLRSKDYDKFIENVKPYILPSFNYKLNPHDRLLRDKDGDIVRTA